MRLHTDTYYIKLGTPLVRQNTSIRTADLVSPALPHVFVGFTLGTRGVCSISLTLVAQSSEQVNRYTWNEGGCSTDQAGIHSERGGVHQSHLPRYTWNEGGGTPLYKETNLAHLAFLPRNSREYTRNVVR